MLGKHWLIGLSGLALIASAATPASGALYYAVNSSHDALYTIDVATCEINIIGPLHPDPKRYMTPIHMAVRPSDGRIFVINNSPSSPAPGDAGLSVVDPTTGRATRIGGAFWEYQALACDLNGTLYSRLTSNGRLATVNPSTGSATQLGTEKLPFLYGLDFNAADGFLYGLAYDPGVTTGVELWKIDPGTGDGVSKVSVKRDGSYQVGTPQTLVFASDGTLYGTSLYDHGSIFQIDPATGAASDFRPVPDWFVPQGMGPVIIPEPSTFIIWCLLASLAITTAWRRRSWRRT